MKVLGGRAKGKTLIAVPGDTTRPVLSRVRSSIFDILRPEIDGIKFLDLFGGTGSIGIEALSQGATHCTFIDLEKKAIEVIKKNLKTCDLDSDAKVVHQDSFSFLSSTKESYDLIYIAPPQYERMWVKAAEIVGTRPELVNKQGLVVVQIDPKENEPVTLPEFNLEKTKNYGNTMLLFFRKKA
jgi:16S rRNA (guanine966-N2)-methyltransferase